jgi:hypothetical protein
VAPALITYAYCVRLSAILARANALRCSDKDISAFNACCLPASARTPRAEPSREQVEAAVRTHWRDLCLDAESAAAVSVCCAQDASAAGAFVLFQVARRITEARARGSLPDDNAVGRACRTLARLLLSTNAHTFGPLPAAAPEHGTAAAADDSSSSSGRQRRGQGASDKATLQRATLRVADACMRAARLLQAMERLCVRHSTPASLSDARQAFMELAQRASGGDEIAPHLADIGRAAPHILQAYHVRSRAKCVVALARLTPVAVHAGSARGSTLADAYNCFAQSFAIASLSRRGGALVTLIFDVERCKTCPSVLEIITSVRMALPRARDGRDFVVVWSPASAAHQVGVVLPRTAWYMLAYGETARKAARSTLQWRHGGQQGDVRKIINAYAAVASALAYSGARAGADAAADAQAGVVARGLAALRVLLGERWRAWGDIGDKHALVAKIRADRIICRFAPTAAKLVGIVCASVRADGGAAARYGDALWNALDVALMGQARYVAFNVALLGLRASLPPSNDVAYARATRAIFDASKTAAARRASRKRKAAGGGGGSAPAAANNASDDEFMVDDDDADLNGGGGGGAMGPPTAAAQSAIGANVEAHGAAEAATRGVNARALDINGEAARMAVVGKAQLLADQYRSHLILLDAMLAAHNPIIEPLMLECVFAARSVRMSQRADSLRPLDARAPARPVRTAAGSAPTDERGDAETAPELTLPVGTEMLCFVLQAAFECAHEPGRTLRRLRGLVATWEAGDRNLPLLPPSGTEGGAAAAAATRDALFPLFPSALHGTLPTRNGAKQAGELARLFSDAGPDAMVRPLATAYEFSVEAALSNYWFATGAGERAPIK